MWSMKVVKYNILNSMESIEGLSEGVLSLENFNFNFNAKCINKRTFHICITENSETYSKHDIKK